MSDSNLCPNCGGPKTPEAKHCMNCRVSPLPPGWQRNVEIYKKIQAGRAAGWVNGQYYGYVEAAREYHLSRQRIAIIVETVEQWIREGRV